MNELSTYTPRRRIRFYRFGADNRFELNFVGIVWNLRIGAVQIALWRNYKPIFDWRRQPRAFSTEPPAHPPGCTPAT